MGGELLALIESALQRRHQWGGELVKIKVKAYAQVVPPSSVSLTLAKLSAAILPNSSIT